MLLKDLKAMKEIKVQRIDNNFIPDNEIIENFEKQVKNEGLEIYQPALSAFSFHFLYL